VVDRPTKSSQKKRKRQETKKAEAEAKAKVKATTRNDDLFIASLIDDPTTNPQDNNVDDQASPPTLKFQTVRGYKTTLINLYFDQHSRGTNTHPHPNGATLQSLMKTQRLTQHQKSKTRHEDRGKGTVADDYNHAELRLISDSFWKHSEEARNLAVGCHLRTNLDFLLGHFMLLRGESRRGAELPDLQLLHLQNEGSSPAPCLLYVMSNEKTNQNNRTEYAGALRHRDIRLCSLSAMANYFVWRWEQFGEKFPSFATNHAWYDTQLLIVMWPSI